MARWRRIHGHLLRRQVMRERSLLARELWKSLWIEEADDYGRFEARARALHGRLYNETDEIGQKDVALALDELRKAGLITIYMVGGEPFGCFAQEDWAQQRIDKPGKPLYPGPEQADRPTGPQLELPHMRPVLDGGPAESEEGEREGSGVDAPPDPPPVPQEAAASGVGFRMPVGLPRERAPPPFVPPDERVLKEVERVTGVKLSPEEVLKLCEEQT